MKTKASALAMALVFAGAMSLFADNRPHEGKVLSIDADRKVLVVQGEKGDQWTLYWTETTKLKDGLTAPELREGDSVHFDYMDRDGKMWITELSRTHKADKD